MLMDTSDLYAANFCLKTKTQLVIAVKRAYAMVNYLAHNNEFLNWPVGKDVHPHLRNAAVEFEIKRLIDDGIIDLTYRINKNRGRNCHHIEITSQQCIVTVSHVQNPSAMPRPADFRQNLSLITQPVLPFENLGFSDSTAEDARYYAILTHGPNDLSVAPGFINIGFPDSGVRRWKSLFNILSELHLIETPEEIIDDNIALEFKDYMLQQGAEAK